MTALQDLMVYLNMDPHPTKATVAVIFVCGLGMVWVVGICIERALGLD